MNNFVSVLLLVCASMTKLKMAYRNVLMNECLNYNRITSDQLPAVTQTVLRRLTTRTM